MGAVSAVFWGVVVLSLLVVLHEGGHFLVARACGMRVTEFFLGMPCKANISRKSRKYGTVFGVTPILLGGYNRISGMENLGNDRLADVLACVQAHGDVTAEQVADELGMGYDAVLDDLMTLVDWGSLAETRDAKGDQEGSRHYRTLRRDAQLRNEFDGDHDFEAEGTSAAGEPRPIADSEAFLAQERARTYAGKGFWRRLAVLVAGPLVNVLLAFVLVVAVLMGQGVETYVDTNVVGGVVEGGLAAKAGIRAGDALVSVGGTKTQTWNGVVEALDPLIAADEPFEVVYERDGVRYGATIQMPGDGSASMIGIQCSVTVYHPSLGEACLAAGRYGALVGRTALQLIMPQHTAEVMSQSSSVVGISVMASQAASSGLFTFLEFIAAVSMSLGFMNLLPIPPLDGGKILIELIQAVIRRPLSLRAQTVVSYLGLAFFLVIFVFALRNDVLNILAG